MKVISFLKSYNLKTQILFNMLFKILAVIVNYSLMTALVYYLGISNFGIYVALTSLYSIMFFFDFGLAKGARNYLTKYFFLENYELLKSIVSSIYIFTFLLNIILCCITIVMINNVDVALLLNINNIKESYIKILLIILTIGFFFRLFLSNIDQILYAFHRSHKVQVLNLIVSSLNLLFIFLSIRFTSSLIEGKLQTAITVYVVSFLVPYILFNVFFLLKYDYLTPSFRYFSLDLIKKIIPVGSKVLIIQIINLFIIGFDRIILLHFGNSVEVAKYEISFKLFSILFFLSSIITAPLWSAFNHAFIKNNFEFINKAFFYFYKILLILIFFVVLISLFRNLIIEIWLGINIDISLSSTILVGLVTICIIWVNFHNDFFLGTNLLKYPIFLGLISVFTKYTLIYIYIENFGNLSFLILISITFFIYLFYLLYPFVLKKIITQM